MTGFLASVATLAEARLVADCGAGIIDLKDPRSGALGAWSDADLARAVRELGVRHRLSATVGDLPMRPARLAAAARQVAASGVDIVKLGFFGNGPTSACIAALGEVAAAGASLVAVLMADRRPDLRGLAAFAQAGFLGVMLDTAGKRAGGLRAHLSDRQLARFVRDGRDHGLLVGLAGSLGLADIAPLARLAPDYLGFRGALCRGQRRAARLDPRRVAAVAQALRAASSAATATAGRQVSTSAAAAGAASTSSPAA